VPNGRAGPGKWGTPSHKVDVARSRRSGTSSISCRACSARKSSSALDNEDDLIVSSWENSSAEPEPPAQGGICDDHGPAAGSASPCRKRWRNACYHAEPGSQSELRKSTTGGFTTLGDRTRPRTKLTCDRGFQYPHDSRRRRWSDRDSRRRAGSSIQSRSSRSAQPGQKLETDRGRGCLLMQNIYGRSPPVQYEGKRSFTLTKRRRFLRSSRTERR